MLIKDEMKLLFPLFVKQNKQPIPLRNEKVYFPEFYGAEFGCVFAGER